MHDTVINSIRIVTSIAKDDNPDERLTFKIDPNTGAAKQQYEPWQEAATSTDWRRQMRYGKIRINTPAYCLYMHLATNNLLHILTHSSYRGGFL